MIFVTVGSRNYPFDRLFKKLDELYEEGVLTEEMYAQTGTSTYKPKHFKYKDFISEEEFCEKVKEADIVVSHGASGSIMKALNEGKKVIAVTRLEKYGEHINDHQIQNNVAFGSNGYVLVADNELTSLGECFQKIYDGTDGLRKWENNDPLHIVHMIDDFIQENWHGLSRN
jgi:UDP-N-acetylglucosamine transferase subunit ALG13